MKIKIKQIFSLVLVSASLVLFGCNTNVGGSEPASEEFGYFKIGSDASFNSARQLSYNELSTATVTVSGYGMEDIVVSGVTINENGCGSKIISGIKPGKNRVVTVTSNVTGGVIRRVTDIVKGDNGSISVGWGTTAVGNVYYELLKTQGEDISSVESSAFSSAISASVHASLVDAASIASDYKTGSLKAASSYILKTGTVNVTAYGFDGCKVQVSDPSSEIQTVSGDEASFTVSNVYPGSWYVYVLDGTEIKFKKSVTVTEDGTSSVTLGSASGSESFNGIQIQVAKSLDYPLIHYWNCSDSATYANTTWPGVEMLTDWCDDDYIFNFDGCSSVNILITKSDETKLYGSDIIITSKGAYRITSSGAAESEYISNVPAVPKNPSVSITPFDSTIAVNGKITITLSNGNDTISSAQVTVSGVASKTYSYSDFTDDVLTINVSELTSEADKTISVEASVTNSVGTETNSAEFKTKVERLVTNPNELRIYQVMVASFQDGDSSIGYTQMWAPNESLKGGDLQGIINAVDYIKDLGCNALWMTPIFDSNGKNDTKKLDATGYYAYDYFNIDSNFGTNEKFAELVETFHENGIAVILDGVFGHWSKSGIATSPNGNTPTRSNGQYAACNYPASLPFFKEVAEYWIKNYKIDGWRFDQCYQVGLGEYAKGDGDNCYTGGHNYWYEIRKVIEDAAASNGTKGSDWGTLGYMVGEHWNGSSTVIQNGSIAAGSASGYGLNSCFDFPSYYKVVQGFACEYGNSSKTSNNITTGLSYLYKTYSDKGYSCLEDDGTYETYYPNFMLTNHDLYRIGDVIKGKWECDYETDEYIGRNKVIIAAQCAYTGPITIYYGDEIGDHSVDLSGWGSDNVARSSGKITGFNTREQTIHDWTQKCLEARANHEALWNGSNTQVTGTSDFYVAKKVCDGETIYIAFNYNASSSQSFSASGTDLLTDKFYSGTVTVPALSAVYLLAD